MDHQAHAMNVTGCDGEFAIKRGTWKGHIYPGIIFILWGAWWTYSVFSYLLWTKTRFRSRSFYPFPHRYLRLTEPILKIILPPLIVSVELYFDHSDGFQALKCPAGTLYAGRFALMHLNNWQHAATYPPLILSGLVDLLSTSKYILNSAEIPSVGHFFLAFSFAVQAFIMGSHEKHEAQDKMVHWLLCVSMLLCLLFVVLEIHAPHNPLPALGRGAAAILQGAWLVQIAKIEYEHLPQWSEEYMGGAMIAPVYFTTISFIVLSCVIALGVLMAVMQHVGLVPTALKPEPLENDRQHQFNNTYFDKTDTRIDEMEGLWRVNNDSARNSSNEGSPSPSRPSFAPFHIISNP